jgi:hypothetical protein
MFLKQSSKLQNNLEHSRAVRVPQMYPASVIYDACENVWVWHGQEIWFFLPHTLLLLNKYLL